VLVVVIAVGKVLLITDFFAGMSWLVALMWVLLAVLAAVGFCGGIAFVVYLLGTHLPLRAASRLMWESPPRMLPVLLHAVTNTPRAEHWALYARIGDNPPVETRITHAPFLTKGQDQPVYWEGECKVYLPEEAGVPCVLHTPYGLCVASRAVPPSPTPCIDWSALPPPPRRLPRAAHMVVGSGYYMSSALVAGIVLLLFAFAKVNLWHVYRALAGGTPLFSIQIIPPMLLGLFCLAGVPLVSIGIYRVVCDSLAWYRYLLTLLQTGRLGWVKLHEVLRVTPTSEQPQGHFQVSYTLHRDDGVAEKITGVWQDMRQLLLDSEVTVLYDPADPTRLLAPDVTDIRSYFILDPDGNLRLARTAIASAIGISLFCVVMTMVVISISLSLL